MAILLQTEAHRDRLHDEGDTLRLDEVRLHDGCMSSSMLIGVGNGVGDGDDDELFTMAMALARAENETTYAMVALELTNMEPEFLQQHFELINWA